MRSAARSSLKKALLALAISVGAGMLFSFFFGFLAGVAAFIAFALAFALRSGTIGPSVGRILFVIGLISVLLVLFFFFDWYGVVFYVGTMLLFYSYRRYKVNQKRPGSPF